MDPTPLFFKDFLEDDVPKHLREEVDGDENVIKTKVQCMTGRDGLVRRPNSGSIRKNRWLQDSKNRAADCVAQKEARRRIHMNESYSDRDERFNEKAQSQRRCRQQYVFYNPGVWPSRKKSNITWTTRIYRLKHHVDIIKRHVYENYVHMCDVLTMHGRAYDVVRDEDVVSEILPDLKRSVGSESTYYGQ